MQSSFYFFISLFSFIFYVLIPSKLDKVYVNAFMYKQDFFIQKKMYKQDF